MRIRPYIPGKDYEYVSTWIDNERTHAFWCANLLPYPIAQESFHNFLEKNSLNWTDSAYVATENNGHAVGFFCYSVNTESNIRFLKFIIVDSTKGGKGYGKGMLNLALQYAFQITSAEAVQLNVFNENTLTKRCYEKVGFVERTIENDVFSYKIERTHDYSIRKWIKRVRTFRGLIQRELGLKLGYEECNADVRIAQYESGYIGSIL